MSDVIGTVNGARISEMHMERGSFLDYKGYCGIEFISEQSLITGMNGRIAVISCFIELLANVLGLKPVLEVTLSTNSRTGVQ